MALTRPGQTGTPALMNDPNAKRILQNRGKIGNLGGGGGTLGKPTSATTYNPANVYQKQQQPQAQPTTAVTTKQSFVSPTDSKQAGMLIEARKYLGKPYRYGGWDCSRFTQTVAAENGVKIPRTAAMQYNWFAKNGRLTKTNSWESARPGDMIYYESKYSPSGWHTGIYVGNGKIIDAAGKKTGTKYSRADKLPIRGIGRM